MEWRRWRDSNYEVSSAGDVRNSRTGRVITPHLKGCGQAYMRVDITRTDGKRHSMVHQLVCEAFGGPRPDGHEAAHLNGNSLDNRAENLVWATPRQNQLHRLDYGKPDGCPYKLTDADVAEVHRLRALGWTLVRIAERFGVSFVAVHYHLSKGQWRDNKKQRRAKHSAGKAGAAFKSEPRPRAAGSPDDGPGRGRKMERPFNSQVPVVNSTTAQFFGGAA